MRRVNALAPPTGAPQLQPVASAKRPQVDKIGQLRGLTQDMLGVPEAGRKNYLVDNWSRIQPIVETDFPTFWNASGGDLSDKSLSEDLAMFDAQMSGQPVPLQASFPNTNDPQGFSFRPRVYNQEQGDSFGEPAALREPETRPTGRTPTDYDKTRDREFAKVITDWTLGGQQQAATNLEALALLIGDLEDPKQNLTGPIVGNTPFKSVFAPAARDAEDRVGRIVQQTLKAVLGAQFAEREAQALIERSYNPKLDESYNVPRLKALYNELVLRAQMNDRAAAYLNEHGVLEGFDGTIPQLEQHSLMEIRPSSQPAQVAPKDLSDEDLLGALGIK